MGINGQNEWLQDCIIELFSNVTGLYGGVEGDTVVYTKNKAKLFCRICDELKCKARYHGTLLTIDEFVYHFEAALEEKARLKAAFPQVLQKIAMEFSGYEDALDAQLFGKLMPTSSKGLDQRKREEIYYEIKLGGFKNFLRNKYHYFKENEAFYRARTLDDLANVLFYSMYCALKRV